MLLLQCMWLFTLLSGLSTHVGTWLVGLLGNNQSHSWMPCFLDISGDFILELMNTQRFKVTQYKYFVNRNLGYLYFTGEIIDWPTFSLLHTFSQNYLNFLLLHFINSLITSVSFSVGILSNINIHQLDSILLRFNNNLNIYHSDSMKPSHTALTWVTLTEYFLYLYGHVERWQKNLKAAFLTDYILHPWPFVADAA